MRQSVQNKIKICKTIKYNTIKYPGQYILKITLAALQCEMFTPRGVQYLNKKKIMILHCSWHIGHSFHYYSFFFEGL